MRVVSRISTRRANSEAGDELVRERGTKSDLTKGGGSWKARRMTTTAQHSASVLPGSDLDGLVVTPGSLANGELDRC
jgi:hypothetical protein